MRSYFIKHWLLQPSMYHYRRRIASATNNKRAIKAMMQAANAYSGRDLFQYTYQIYAK